MKKVFVIVAVMGIICAAATVGYSADYWARTYGGGGNDYGISIQQAADGGYAIFGYTSSFGSGNDYWMVKFDSNGDVIWQKIIMLGVIFNHDLCRKQ